MGRKCRCPEDDYPTKLLLLEKIANSHIIDDKRTIYIGIVFHICFTPESDINDDVSYTIDMLNGDYNKRGKNFDCGRGIYQNPELSKIYDEYLSLASESNITFYLVEIKHQAISSSKMTNLDEINDTIKKNSPPVEPSRYLNLWIADLHPDILGVSNFPWESKPETDGVVISKLTFGKNPYCEEYGLNKTMTHEIGHWLGLYHIFQETLVSQKEKITYLMSTNTRDTIDFQTLKGDCISDTPPQAEPTFGNPFLDPTTWPTSRPLDESKEHYHMFMNFMDYCDDPALFMFTKNQVEKMRKMIYIYRPNILENDPRLNDMAGNTVEMFDPNHLSQIWKSYHFVNNGRMKIRSGFRKKLDDQDICTSKNGNVQFGIELSHITSAVLMVNVYAKNKKTRIWIKYHGDDSWYITKIPVSSRFRRYLINLPIPNHPAKKIRYTICMGTSGRDSEKSYFNSIGLSYLTVESR